MNKNDTLFIVTGTTQGLGNDIFSELLKDTENIVTINRSLFNYSQNLVFDFEDIDNIENNLFFKLEKIISKFNNIIIILNASMIDPIKEVGNYKNLDVIKIINTNVISQTLLINFIVKQNKNGIAINVTSGAVEYTINGLGLYSMSKSAMYKFFEVSDNEISNIKFMNYDPGSMNTQMQEKLRHEDSHTDKKYKLHIRKQHKEGTIKTSKASAQRLVDEITNMMKEV